MCFSLVSGFTRSFKKVFITNISVFGYFSFSKKIIALFSQDATQTFKRVQASPRVRAAQTQTQTPHPTMQSTLRLWGSRHWWAQLSSRWYRRPPTWRYSIFIPFKSELYTGHLGEFCSNPRCAVFPDSSGWWTGRLRGKEGMFPGNYVEKI